MEIHTICFGIGGLAMTVGLFRLQKSKQSSEKASPVNGNEEVVFGDEKQFKKMQPAQLTDLIKPKSNETKYKKAKPKLTKNGIYLSNDTAVNSRIALSVLAEVWGSKETRESYVNLSKIWREPGEEAAAAVQQEIIFKNPRLTHLYEHEIKGKSFYVGAVKSVLDTLLNYLDENSEVSSVVGNDVYGVLSENVYNTYAKVTLLDHTMNVVNEMINSDNPNELRMPKILITALAHDIGKLKCFDEAIYSIGHHPQISITILQSMDRFNEIPHAKDIVLAIQNHHIPNASHKLTKLLKNADGAARQLELATSVAEPKADTNGESQKSVTIKPKKKKPSLFGKPEKAAEISAPEQPIETAAAPQAQESEDKPTFKLNVNKRFKKSNTEKSPAQEETPKPVVQKPVVKPVTPASEQTETNIGQSNQAENEVNIAGTPETKNEKRPFEEKDISWLNINMLIANLEPFINKVTKNNYSVFSTKNGVIYANPETIWQVICELAKEQGESWVFEGNTDKHIKGSILHTVVNKMRDKDMLVSTMIDEEYYGTYITQIFTKGKDAISYATPIYAHVFPKTISDYELKKNGKLRDLVEVSLGKQKRKDFF